MCSFGGGEYFAGENYFENRARARVARACAECEFPIPAGERHLRVLFVGDGEDESWVGTKRFFLHRACAKLAPRAAEIACGSRDHAVGELLEHLDYAEEALLVELGWTSEPTYDVDYIDPDDAREILLAFSAIEQRYSGDEYELGGEG